MTDYQDQNQNGLPRKEEDSMKILKPIKTSTIPSGERGRGASKYDSLVDQMSRLGVGKSLPVEFESVNAAISAYSLIRKRYPEIGLARRKAMLYLTAAIPG